MYYVILYVFVVIYFFNTAIKKAHENTYTCFVENKFGRVESKLLIEISGLGK